MTRPGTSPHTVPFLHRTCSALVHICPRETASGFAGRKLKAKTNRLCCAGQYGDGIQARLQPKPRCTCCTASPRRTPPGIQIAAYTRSGYRMVHSEGCGRCRTGPFRITSLFKPDEYRPRQDAFLEPVVSAANRKMVKLVAYKPPGQDAGKEDWNLAVLVRRTRLSDQSTWLRAHDRKAALSEAARRRDTFKIFRAVSPHSHPASTGEHHSRGAVRHWSCGFTQTEQTVGAVIAADAALLADTRARHARVSITSSAKSCRGANDVRVAVVSDRRLRASAFRKSQEQSEQPENGVENLHR